MEILITSERHIVNTILAESPAKARVSEVLGFLPQEFLSFALPAQRCKDLSWTRRNGEYTYTVTAGTIMGADGQPVTELPSGKYARAAAMYLCTRAKLTRSRRVEIPSAYRTVFSSMGMEWQGMASGREAVRQLMLLAACTVTVTRQAVNESTGEELYEDKGARFSESMTLWTTKNRAQISSQGDSEIVLSPMMMDMIDRAVPIKMESWRWLLSNSRSPMALDVYVWLCGRLFRINGHVRVTWSQIYEQFGSRSSLKRFKGNFRDALETALKVFPEAKIEEDQGTNRIKGFKGYHLYPSPDPRDSKLPE